jgi:flagellar protein FlaI
MILMPLPKIRKKAPVNPPSIRVIVKRLKKGGRSAARSSKQRISERNMNIYFEGDKRVFFPLVGGQEQQRPQEKKEETDDSGIDLSLSDLQKPLQSPLTSEEKDILRRISVKYPLIPRFPRPNEKVYAYAHIQWDPKRNAIVYNVIEPFISQKEKDVIEAVKKELEERLDVDFLKIGKIKAKDVLRQEIRDIFSKMGIGSRNTDVLQYYIERDIIGLGKIEPFMRDGEIEDVSCDGERVPLHVYHRNPLIGSIVTNVLFEGGEELDTFVMKLAQKCGKSISVAEPLVDGSLPEGSRVQATLATDIARKGSNFTIRKFASDPLTPVHMLEYGTMDSTQMAYMWLIIENRKSVLISGGTATGKTSMLNALSLFIKPSLKIVSIEDTPELKIPHERP